MKKEDIKMLTKNERTNKSKKINAKKLLTRKACALTLMLSLALNIGTVSTVNAFDETGTMNEIGQEIVVSTVIPIDENDAEFNEKVSKEIEAQTLLEQEIMKQIKQEEKVAYINSIICDPNNISRVSGLKEEDYKLLTSGTWWEGNEQALIDLEKNYGVNAMFAMAVSTLESASGTSGRAKNRNNYYGLELSKVWNGLYSNTQYWGGLIAKSYIGQGRTSATSISTKYCPPNSSNWASFVNSQMGVYYNKLISKLNDTEI